MTLISKKAMEDFLDSHKLLDDSSKLLIPESCKRVKIDVGLSLTAPMSEKWLSEDSDLYVFGFEPASESIAALLDDSFRHPVKITPLHLKTRFCLVQCALGENHIPSGVELMITNDLGTSSLLTPLEMNVKKIERVEIFALSDFLVHFPFERIPYIDHIKIDVQGTDFNVLKGIEDYFDRIAAITIEIETGQYHGNSNDDETIVDFMKQHQFFQIERGHHNAAIRNIRKMIFRVLCLLLRLKITVEVSDPTFINKKTLFYFQKRKLWLYQRG